MFNEGQTIENVLNKLIGVNLLGDIQKEIIVVDDFSTDNSKSLVENVIQSNKNSSIFLIGHDKNKGKGAALHTGIKSCSGDLVVIQDADLEYDPNEFNLMLKPFLDGHADVVYGSRFMGGKPHRVLFFWHTIGNKLLTFMSNMFNDLNITDMETCYKMFRSDILKQIELKEKRFGFEPEVTAKISRVKGIRIYEVGISYYGRTFAEGKKIGWKDGFRALYCIAKYNKWT
jgi:glycosyltransferase involved in cell wall biosynthesis